MSLTLELSRPVGVVVSNNNENQANNKPDANPAATKETTDLSPISYYDEIVERPLFREDRRPYVPKAIAAPEPQRPEPNRRKEEEFKLSAVIITDDSRLALIEHGGSHKMERFRQGENLNGWLISHVEARRVILERGTETRILELNVSPSESAQSAPQSSGTEVKSTGPAQQDETTERQWKGEQADETASETETSARSATESPGN